MNAPIQRFIYVVSGFIRGSLVILSDTDGG